MLRLMCLYSHQTYKIAAEEKIHRGNRLTKVQY